MYSQKSFIPGSRTSTKRMIMYVAEYNGVFPNQNPMSCVCHPNKYDKFTVSSDGSSRNLNYNQRVSYLCKRTLGGSTQYGNYYLGQQPNINYLGRVEGMPGGSGLPPINRFY